MYKIIVFGQILPVPQVMVDLAYKRKDGVSVRYQLN